MKVMQRGCIFLIWSRSIVTRLRKTIVLLGDHQKCLYFASEICSKIGSVCQSTILSPYPFPGFSSINTVCFFWIQKNHNIVIYISSQNLLFLCLVSLQYLTDIFTSRKLYFISLNFSLSPFFMFMDSTILVLSNIHNFLLTNPGFLNYSQVGWWTRIFPMITLD